MIIQVGPGRYEYTRSASVSEQNSHGTVTLINSRLVSHRYEDTKILGLASQSETVHSNPETNLCLTILPTSSMVNSGSNSPLTGDLQSLSAGVSRDPSPSPANRTALKTSRRTHPKTRTGCGTCKRRKIKCDETRPSCRNCVRHSVECDFTTVVKPDATPGLEPPISLLDLELLHNFTSSTYSTLTSDPTTRNIWKTAVLRKATGCEFVMRTLLAVSGMHIAQYRPDQNHLYVSHAMAHHKAASRTAISLMVELLPQHQENLWIFSVLTIYFALGSPRDTSASLLIGERVLPDWIFLLNGVHHLLIALQSSSYSGILSPILKNGATRWQASHQPEHKEANVLHELTAHVRSAVADPEELAIYEKAIEELRCQVGFVLSSERRDLDIMDAFVWHFSMADSFMPLLKEMKQEAVAIFAYSLIILNALDGHKWLHGWDTFLLSRIWDILDDEHRLWIQWPIEEIGWVPPSTPLV